MSVTADSNFEARVRESFSRHPAMTLIGGTLGEVAPGEAAVHLPYRREITQQHGFIHGGIVGMIADTACGYAAFSLMPPSATLLTVEYKINILAPARSSLVARGSVIKAGRRLTIARAEVYADDGKHVATMQQTLMILPDTPDAPP